MPPPVAPHKTRNIIPRPSLRPAALLLVLFAPAAFLASQSSKSDEGPTYFEFGQVISIGSRNVVVQTYDEVHRALLQHNFTLSRDSRADVVHVGDAVEVIYSPGPKEWLLRRMVALSAGIPKAGPPPLSVIPTAPRSSANLGGQPTSRSKPQPSAPQAAPVNLSGSPTSAASIHPGTAVDLGNAAQPKLATVKDVPLGATPEEMKNLQPRAAKEVARAMPAEECNRSSADWPTQPLRIAVLDFRYPTEREESHDIGTTGGGSGTAVADLVFSRLSPLTDFALSRGDRDRLYRADFAGAARIGRQLGVDAVLAGTFLPVDPTSTADDTPANPRAYELRAGIVDTCTGQLLARLSSAKCEGGIDPGPNPAPGSPTAVCQRFSVSPAQAADPQAAASSYKPALDALLFPLEHNGPPPNTAGSAGVVTAASGRTVTIHLPAGSGVKTGDQVSLHAWGIMKDPTTYTLRRLYDEEIGRVTIERVQGSLATGTYAGDIPPKPADTAELITQ